MSDLPIEEPKGSIEYTPGLMEIRDAVADWLGVDAFDRWLAAHDAELVRVRDEQIAAVTKFPAAVDEVAASLPSDPLDSAWREDIRKTLSGGDFDIQLVQIESAPDFLSHIWKPGERGELVALNPLRNRPGVVVRVNHRPVIHHYLEVRFDDGEQREINPDVMRHVRGEEAPDAQ